MQEALNYFHGDELAAKVWIDKYALRNKDNNLLEKTPDEMHRRIAKELARVESKKFAKSMSEDEIYGYLKNFGEIIPQGSPMYGIGNPSYVTISNCYVLDSPLDSYAGIHWTDEQITQISKRRGGVGLDISNLRPDFSPTTNSCRISSGILAFMERYSNTIREVGQNGRRGALMITISVHHPQILDFAKVKSDLKKVTGANISIRLTNEFLNAVENDEEYELRWPVKGEKKYSKFIKARLVWDEIITQAWLHAEPGLLFWDLILEESPADCYIDFGFETIATNPCSELGLCALDSCRLLLLNLFAFVSNPFTSKAKFDFERFYKSAQVAQRFMDDIVDLELECIDRIVSKIKSDPEPRKIKKRELSLWKRIKAKCETGRRTGTGTTALGDTIAAVGLKYGSDEANDFAEKIYLTLKLGCYRSSVDMAKELGPFPIWNPMLEKKNPFLNRIKEEDSALFSDMRKYGRRNISLLTSAPAGSVSILAGPEPRYQTTSGIEPLFKEGYTRRKKIVGSETTVKVDFVDDKGDKWQEFTVYHPKLKLWMDITGETDITKSPYHGCCAGDLDWEKRVEMQGRIQKHIDHSISSTLNLPENVSKEEVAKIYMFAWKKKCKGITVYRENCRTGVLVDKDELPKHDAKKRPKEVECETHNVKVQGQNFFVIVGLLGKDPYEVFVGPNEEKNIPSGLKGKIVKEKRGKYDLAKEGEVVYSDIAGLAGEHEESVTRLVSTSLRHGTKIDFLVHQLEKAKGDMQSFSKALARVLKKYIADGARVTGEQCPTCNSQELVRAEGCIRCNSCGFSKCS